MHLLLVRVQYKDIIIYIEIILYVGLFVAGREGWCEQQARTILLFHIISESL